MKRAFFIIIKAAVAVAVFGLAAMYLPRFFAVGDFVPKTNEVPNILVRQPLAGSSELLPFTIGGEARVFENIFNYELRDAADDFVLAEGNGYANAPDIGEFGQFMVDINFLRRLPVGEDVVLEAFDYSAKDGKKENQVVVPFKLIVKDPQTLKVFFGKEGFTEADCKTMTAVSRIVPVTVSPARRSLELLLEGPMKSELNKGYYTVINPGVKIQGLTIANGVATADFDETLDKNIGGSCRVAAIRSQIVETLKQFPAVKSVIIAISGRTEDILQP
ncbi:MAG: GerMN domain-containing protein [Patescibacteria group bacterium]|nr:GerMN domain-containing protein [Patescibacteria group bacterium]MCL5261816.1 GerMN domain-containing protein [Patescibacteria group bacterium]